MGHRGTNTVVHLEDILYTSIVTLFAAVQLTYFAKWVGQVRKLCRIPYPQMTGNVMFERALRAQQNTLEFFPVFMISLWVSALFFNQIASTVFGVIYILSRYVYFKGYSRSVHERLFGFRLGARCLTVMAWMSGAGLLNTILSVHFDYDLAVMTRKGIQEMTGLNMPV